MLVVLCSSVLLTSCVNITDENGNQLDWKKSGAYYAFSGVGSIEGTSELRAIVKGSIYETGEYMSVFGTCLNGEDNPINGTYASFSAWYPNGTQFVFNISMPELSGNPGYHLHQSYMQNVQGTYLTSMECRITGDNVTKALAFGEWQNPYWVYRLNLLNQSLSDVSSQLINVSLQINNVSVEIGQGFNITWDKLDQLNATINNTFISLNESIYYVATVANSSVDRNDSYLALLILNLTGNLFGNNSGNPLSYEIVREDAQVYMRDWGIRVNAVDTNTDDVIQYPDSLCYINTTHTPTTLMTPNGNQWRFNEVIRSFSYSYSISCQFA